VSEALLATVQRDERVALELEGDGEHLAALVLGLSEGERLMLVIFEFLKMPQ